MGVLILFTIYLTLVPLFATVVLAHAANSITDNMAARTFEDLLKVVFFF